MTESRIGRNGRATLPLDVRRAPRLRAGDTLVRRIEARRVALTRLERPADDPFAAFSDWKFAADRAAYARF